jgi:hypothetical protein
MLRLCDWVYVPSAVSSQATCCCVDRVSSRVVDEILLVARQALCHVLLSAISAMAIATCTARVLVLP